MDYEKNLFVGPSESYTFEVAGESFSVQGPCYVSPDGKSIYFPDHDMYMSVPRWQRDFKGAVERIAPARPSTP